MSETVRVVTEGGTYERCGDLWSLVADYGDGIERHFPRTDDIMVDGEEAVHLLDALAARERELAEARKSAESFEQEAAYRAQNTDYWQGIAEQARADLAAVEAKRMEAVQVLRALWNDATGGKKACEHEFTCNCAGDLARALLAREAGDGGI